MPPKRERNDPPKRDNPLKKPKKGAPKKKKQTKKDKPPKLETPVNIPEIKASMSEIGHSIEQTITKMEKNVKQKKESVSSETIERIQQYVSRTLQPLAKKYPQNSRIIHIIDTSNATLKFFVKMAQTEVIPQIDDIEEVHRRYALHGYEANDAQRLAINDITEQINLFMLSPNKQYERQRQKTSPDDIQVLKNRFWKYWNARIRANTEDLEEDVQNALVREKKLSRADVNQVQMAQELHRQASQNVLNERAKQVGIIGGVAAEVSWYYIGNGMNTLGKWIYSRGVLSAPTSIGGLNLGENATYFLGLASSGINNILQGLGNATQWLAESGSFGSITVAILVAILLYILSGLLFRLGNDVKVKASAGIPGIAQITVGN